MYEKIVEEGFKRGVEFEITNIKKKNLRLGRSIIPGASQENERAQDHLR